MDSVIDELWADPEVQLQPEDGWQDYLQRLAHGVRRFAMAHPRAFPLVATRPPEAPFVRPPLRSLRWVDAFLTALRGKGFTDEAVLYAYRSFTSFLLGHLLLEAGARSAEDPAALRWQHRLTPLQRRVAAGCHGVRAGGRRRRPSLGAVTERRPARRGRAQLAAAL